MKISCSYFLFCTFLFLCFFPPLLRAQDCDLGPDNVKSDPFQPSGTHTINTGDATPFEVFNGAEYVFNTCNSTFNTKVTLHKTVGTFDQHISSTNDNICAGNGERITWLSDFSGTLWITITNAACNYNSTSAILFIEQNDNLRIADLQDQRASCGGTITFNADASTTGSVTSFTYQWQENKIGTWKDLVGEVYQTITLRDIEAARFGTQYRVRVGLGGYQKYSNEAKIIESSIDPPAGFIATDDLCTSEIELEWQWYMTNPISFLVEYSRDSDRSSWDTLTEVSGSERRYLHEGIERGRTYAYRISTYSDACGSYTNSSSVVQGISPTVPVAPTNVAGSIVAREGGKNIAITWQDNSDNEDGFRLYKLSDNGISESFRIQSSKYIKKNKGQVLEYLDEDASNCEPYTYRVYAYNVCNTDGVRDVQEEKEITLTVPLDDVINLSSMEASRGYYPDKVTINWGYEEESNYRYADGYKIYSRELGTSVAPELVHNVGREFFSWETNLVKAGTLYEYFFVARGSCGQEELLSYNILDSISTLESRISSGEALIEVLPETGLGYAIGFRSPSGLIHGRIAYVGGVAVPEVKVTVSRNSGTVGNALYFDGVDDYIEVDSTERLNTLTNTFSIAVWVRPERITSGIQFIANKTKNFALGTSGGDAFFYVSDGNYGWHRVTVPDILTEDQYIHLTATYADGEVNMYVNGDFAVKQTVPVNNATDRMDRLFIGGIPWGDQGYFFAGYIDELRIFSEALDSVRVKKDYSRLISSSAPGLVAYWRVEEGAGPYLFDFARSEGIFHQNDGRIRGAQWSGTVPTQRQLGMAGYTDAAGNYTVNGIFYSGTGESFDVIPTITLSGAVHEFSPSQRLEFIGEASSVINNIDYEDISSFRVTGQVLFLHNSTYAGSPGVSFYVDGATPIIGANGQPVLSNTEGDFDIQVPIGLHSIVARKPYHDFDNDGAWPVLHPSHDFQDDVNGIIFTDTTKRKIIGRVVGGLIEGEKTVGFGLSTNNIGQASFILRSQDGKVEENITTHAQSGEFSVALPPKRYTVYRSTLPTEAGIDVNNNPAATNDFVNLPNLDISSIIRAEWEEHPVYDPNDADVLLRTDSVDYHLKHNFIYRSLPQITVQNGEEGKQGQPFTGESFYVYQNIQGLRDTVDMHYGDPGGSPFPVFKKLSPYKMHISLLERYTNRDIPGNPVYSQAPVTDGTLTISNFIGKGFYEDETGSVNYYADGAPGNNPDIIELENTQGDTTYTFVAAEPDIAINTADIANSFTRSLQITAQAAGNVVYWPGPTQHALFRGYVFGSTPVGSSFVTKAPDMVDFILRDPPGSGSVAEFSRGHSISSSQSLSLYTSYENETEIAIGASVTTFTGAGIGVFAGIINEAAAEATVGLSFSLGLGYDGEWVQTYTVEESFGTSEDLVGAEGDIYVGRSQNYRFGIAQTMALVPDTDCSKDEVGCPFDGQTEEFLLTSRSGVVYQIGSKVGLFLTPEGTPTFFIYTQTHILDELIPRLQELRNTLLLDNPKYVAHVAGDHESYGANNDHPDWSNPTSSYPETDPSVDFTGPSYTFSPASNEDIDSVRWYNQQIRLWEQSIADNERAKVNAFNSGAGENKSFSALTSYTSTITSTRSEEHSVVFETAAGISVGFSTDLSLFGVSLEIGIQQTISLESSVGTSHGVEEEVSYSYTLSDEDEGDFFSVDVFSGENNNGPIFILRDGGESSCPHEEAFVTEYFQPGTQLGSGTLQRDKARLEVAVPTFYNVPANVPAVYTLTLYNDSESRDEREYVLDILDDSNPNGASITIDGKPVDGTSLYSISANSSIQKTMLVSKGPYEYSYENMAIEMQSSCDEDVNDGAQFSAYFSPTCTDLAIENPVDNWVVNSNFNDTLSITVGQYNINYEGLDNILLKYKPSSASAWILLDIFYRDTTGMHDSKLREIPRDNPSLTYDWALGLLPDASYDIIAVSNCEAPDIGTEISTESTPFSGLVDRLRPHVFGRPQPADGILSPADEIMIQLNEPLNTGVLSAQNFDIRGVLNGGDIRHPASVFFDGDEAHYMRITEGAIDLSKKSFTIDFYARRAVTGAAVLFSQGTQPDEALVIGFTSSDIPYFALAGKVVSSNTPVTDNKWHHYAFTYDLAGNNASLSVDAQVQAVNNTFSTVYSTVGEIQVGKSTVDNAAQPFTGNMHELRIWNKVLTEGEVAIAAVKRMDKANLGLIANWRMEEATGDVAKDHIRSKHADVYADWQLEPAGYALAFNGVDQYAETTSPGFGRGYDFSIAFWFKSDQTAEVCLLSNGRGDAQDLNIDAWAIGVQADGNVFVHHQGGSLVSTDRDYHDGTWHHLALIVSRVGNTLLYVDGEELSSTLTQDFNAFAGPKLWLGARGWYEGAVERRDLYFTGLLDDIRIWNSARKDTQIEVSRFAKLQGDEVGIRRYYPFDKYVLDGGVATLSTSLASFVDGEERDVLQLHGATYSNQTPPVKIARPTSKLSFTFSANGDRIILAPTIDNARIENVLLDITVKDLHDLHGNTLASPVTWSAYVDRNQVVWKEESNHFDIALGEALTFNTVIHNNSGAVQRFDIHNLPPWLSVNPQSGSLHPLSSRDIAFTIGEGINIGQYLQDVYLRSDFGFDERFSIEIKVRKSPPANWQIDPSQYQFSMSIIGQVRMDGVISRDPEDRIVAYVGNEPRGMVSLQQVPSLNSYIAYLSVYSNQNSGEEVEFRVWDASEGQIHARVTPAFSFTANSLHGSVGSPVVFDVPDFIQKELNFREGWQWISFNVEEDNMQVVKDFMANMEASEGDIIKSVAGFDQYSTELGWVGQLTENGGLNPADNYKLKLSAASTLYYGGVPVDPEDLSISLVQGWNWVGFTPQKSLPIATALSNLTLEVGDQIKSQLQFAVYAGGSIGWVGSLKTLTPGNGYMIYASTATRFTYPNALVAYSSLVTPDALRTQSLTEEFEPGLYQDNMTVVAELPELALGPDDLLFARINGEERGVGSFEELPNGRKVAFLTLFEREKGGKVHFLLRNVASQQVTQLVADTPITFEPDGQVGSPLDPVILRAGVQGYGATGMLQLLPNPLVNDMHIVFDNPQERLNRIEVFSITGERLAAIDKDQVAGIVRRYKVTLSRWIGNRRGVFIIKVYSDQATYTRRAIRQ